MSDGEFDESDLQIGKDEEDEVEEEEEEQQGAKISDAEELWQLSFPKVKGSDVTEKSKGPKKKHFGSFSSMGMFVYPNTSVSQILTHFRFESPSIQRSSQKRIQDSHPNPKKEYSLHFRRERCGCYG